MDFKNDLPGVCIDWANNFQQPFGNSNDMKASIAFAKEFVKNHPYSSVTFIGHSKGGAEAIANAVATNKNAIVFNPATAALDKYDLPIEGYEGTVTSYVVQGEPLNSLSGILGKNIGNEIPISPRHDYGEPWPQWDWNVGSRNKILATGKYLFETLLHSKDVYFGKHDVQIIIDYLESPHERF